MWGVGLGGGGGGDILRSMGVKRSGQEAESGQNDC